MVKIRKSGIAIISGFLGIVAVGGAWKAGLFDRSRLSAAQAASSVPSQVALPSLHEAPAATGQTTAPVRMPETAPAVAGQPVRFLGYAWNAQMGLMFANGGPITTQGSLMTARGVRLTLGRQDDNAQLQAELVSCAEELARGAADCTHGVQFVAIMGDGAATFMHGLNTAMQRLGPAYYGEIVASSGFSRGEDKFMGPPAWRDHPEAARGGLVAGVLRDGDWNIAMFWAANNNICNNPNPETYDPGCLNWVGTNDYLQPAEKYNQNACEDRPVVHNGRPTGQRQHACVQALVTWTPGDVNVFTHRGGLVSLLSTRENRSQMPQAFIGIHAWNQAHQRVVVGMIEAMAEGGQAVNSDPAALSLAAQVSDAVYHESGTGAMYWETYYTGRTQIDRVSHQPIFLGGSRASNLADMLNLFGMTPGAANAFEATYTAFGNIAHQQYPGDLPEFPAFATVSDTSYLRQASNDLGAVAAGTVEPAVFTPQGAATAPVVARRNWTINFQSGSSDFSADAQNTLHDLERQLVVASGTYIEVHGHTDDVGDRVANLALSERRAAAVRTWLTTQASQNFPTDRIRTFGHGPDNPLVQGASPEARARNRRVEVVLRAVGG